MKTVSSLALALLLAGGWTATVVAARAQERQPLRAARAELPDGAVELLQAIPFVVDEPFVHEWRAEKPLVRAGYILVLQVDPERARPRETYEAVLYVGMETAERCSFPEEGDSVEGGRLVALVPAPVDTNGRVALDLDSAPIWFGSLELPERVDAARVTAELAAARAAGIGPARRDAGTKLRSLAAETVHVRTRAELLPYLEDLGGTLR